MTLLRRALAVVTRPIRERRAAMFDQLGDALDNAEQFHAADIVRGVAAQTRLA